MSLGRSDLALAPFSPLLSIFKRVYIVYTSFKRQFCFPLTPSRLSLKHHLEKSPTRQWGRTSGVFGDRARCRWGSVEAL